jgi:geranylgeranyl diphosphate synthase type I
MAAAYEACSGEGGGARGAAAGAALEMVQAYLLTHDDWMDGDDVRRGGPSVPAALRDAFGDERLGAAAAVLVGDLAAGVAQTLLLEVEVAPVRQVEAARVFARMQEDVVFGQALDLLEASSDVETKHDLKTGSYTVRGPLALGAALAGAGAAERDALDRYARPLGVAFQLRDDLLGVFGDPAQTGKPRGSDLRQGKRTALIAAVEGDRVAAVLLPRVLGVADAPDEEIKALVERIVESGAKETVEARIDACLAESRRALEGAPFAERPRVVLAGAITALGDRER